jgi:hypothetical protein
VSRPTRTGFLVAAGFCLGYAGILASLGSAFASDVATVTPTAAEVAGPIRTAVLGSICLIGLGDGHK